MASTNSTAHDHLEQVIIKQRLIHHYNRVAMQWLNKAVVQSIGLKRQRELSSWAISNRKAVSVKDVAFLVCLRAQLPNGLCMIRQWHV